MTKDFDVATPLDLQKRTGPSPREIIDAVVELLVRDDCSISSVGQKILELEGAVLEHFGPDDELFREVVFNSPWLTPQSESLRQQRQELLETIGELRALAHDFEDSTVWREHMQEKFQDFVELFIEQEDGVQNLLQSQGGPDEF